MRRNGLPGGGSRADGPMFDDDVKDGRRGCHAYPVIRPPQTFGFELQSRSTRLLVGFCPKCGGVMAVPNDGEGWRLLRCDWCLWSGPTHALEAWTVYDPSNAAAFREGLPAEVGGHK